MRRIIAAMATVLFFISFYAWTCDNVMGKHVIQFNGYSLGSVGSNAMSPTLFKGDAFIASKKESYSPGDIIAFKESSYVGVSKVISIDEETISLSYGSSVTSKDIYGEVVFRVPGVGICIEPLFSFEGVLIIFGVMSLSLFSCLFKKQRSPQHI